MAGEGRLQHWSGATLCEVCGTYMLIEGDDPPGDVSKTVWCPKCHYEQVARFVIIQFSQHDDSAEGERHGG